MAGTRAVEVKGEEEMGCGTSSRAAVIDPKSHHAHASKGAHAYRSPEDRQLKNLQGPVTSNEFYEEESSPRQTEEHKAKNGTSDRHSAGHKSKRNDHPRTHCHTPIAAHGPDRERVAEEPSGINSRALVRQDTKQIVQQSLGKP